jgi:hypothetical protein
MDLARCALLPESVGAFLELGHNEESLVQLRALYRYIY